MITNAEAENRGYIKNREWKSGTSFPEQFIYRCFLQLFPRTDNRYIESLCNMEFDVYVPELNLRVEFSGEYWHSSERKEQRDQRRRDFCLDHNMVYVEIIDRTDTCDFRQETNGKHIVYTLHTGGDLKKAIPMLVAIIRDILNRFNLIDTNVDYIRAIYEAYLFSAKYMYKTVKDDESSLVGISYISGTYGNFNYFYKDSATKMVGEDISLYARELPKDVVHVLDFSTDISRIMFKDPVTKNMGTGGDILKAREQRVEEKEKELYALNEKVQKRLDIAKQIESKYELAYEEIRQGKKLKKINKMIYDAEERYEELENEINILRVEILNQAKKEIALEKECIDLEKEKITLAKKDLESKIRRFDEMIEEFKVDIAEQLNQEIETNRKSIETERQELEEERNNIELERQALEEEKKQLKNLLQADFEMKLKQKEEELEQKYLKELKFEREKCNQETRKLQRKIMSLSFNIPVTEN